MALTIGVNARRKSGKGTEYVRKDELLSPDGKVKPERLPEGAGGSAEGGSVDLQPLEKRVAALENAPKGEGDGNSLGVYDKSVYTKVLNESELLSQLTSEQRGNYERLNRLCRAAFCWKNLSGIETGQDTAEKIVLEDGTVFQRLTDGKLNRNVGGLFDVYSVSFYNLSTLQKVDFLRVSLPGLNKVIVAQVESDTEDLNEIIGGRFVGRFFRLEETNYTAEDASTGNTSAAAVKEKADEAKAAADKAKETADGAKTAADGAKTVADKAKETAISAKETAERAENAAHEYSLRLTTLEFNHQALESKVQKIDGSITDLERELTSAKYTARKATEGLENLRNNFIEDHFEIANGERRRGDEDGGYLPRLFFHKIYGDVCVRVGSGVFKLLNKGLCFRFYRDESDSGLWHERQYYTFMDREVEVKVLDYRVDDENDTWKIVGEHPSSKSPQEQIKELFGL